MLRVLAVLLFAEMSAKAQLQNSIESDGIVYQQNEIEKASANCELGFCKKKVVEDGPVVVWFVLPECSKGEAELSKEKYKY